MTRASDRLTWAVGCLDVQPGEELLELGCGHGVAVSRVCERLRGGRSVALARSPTMTAIALRRNRAHVEAGRAQILTTELHAADLGGARFDKVFGVHFPPLLRGDGTRELATIAAHLAPTGTLYVIFQPFTRAGVRPALDRLGAVLAANGFSVSRERVEPVGDALGVCVEAAAGAAQARSGRSG